MKISILSYSFHGALSSGELDLFGYLEACRYRYALNAADLWSGHFASIEPDYVAKVKNALEERDLYLADIAVDGAHLWEDEAEKRAANYERAKTFLNIAATLGAKVVRIDAGSRAEAWTTEQFDFIVKRYQEYCDFAKEHGFIVALENHWGPEKKWANLKAVFEAVNKPNFGVCVHIGGWAGTPEEKAAADRAVAPWVVHTHFGFDTCSNPELLKEKVSNLWNAGYQHHFSAEVWAGKRELFVAGVQLALLRDMLDQVRRGVA